MFKKIFSILLFSILLAPITTKAQVQVEAKIDNMAMLIGDQVEMTISVTAPQDKVVQMPRMKARELICPGVEIVEISNDDTTKVDDATRRISRRLTLTSFDENAYMIPEQVIKVGGKEYKTNPLALKVLMVDVDTVHLNQFFGPKDVQDNPFLWAEWSPLFWISVIVVLLALFAVFLYVRLKQNKPIVLRMLIIKHIPAHKKALDAIDRIKQDKMQTSEDQKTYYTQLTDTLRKYIEERFGFSAMEMTTTEIIARLNESGDPKMIAELRELFETADLVKFAKHSTLINENDLNLVNAINFIDQTKTQDVEHEERIAPKLSDDDKRVRESRIVMKTMLWVIAVVVVLALAFVLYNIMLLI